LGLEPPRLIQASDLLLSEKFDCGTPVLDQWLRVHAWTNHQSGSSRVYLSIDNDARLIAGFYCLSAGSVEHAAAPARVSKGLARHPIPVVLIGRLAVDRHYAGRGLGRFLMRDAYHRIVQTADTIGTRAIIVQAKTADAAEFYRRLGFDPFSTHSLLFYQLLKDVRKSLDAARLR